MGKGGGGGGRTPVEAKESGRSKQLVKIVEIISEGEIEGLADGMKSVYLDNTPIQNNDGSYNFSNVQLEGRVGSQVQEIIPGFNTSEKEVNVGTQVRKATPITRTITDGKVSRLRLTLGVQSLFSQNDQGDTNGASVSLTVYIGNQSYPITISGKYSSQYLQQHTFSNLPAVPFTVRVERNTADSKSQRLQNNTVWASYTEIIDTEFTYPNTALIGVKFDSEYFSSIPNRTYDVKGIKVKVPSNYDPKTRQYRGMWDGTFKIDWSDNPAWVLYDIVTNKRYGLGQRLGNFGADKWALYQVAQYCDQLVPDGFGGKEPRFTCNAWLTDQRPAYDVINDICSIFRAMPVWNGRELTVVMDRPSDPVWTYTNANVENGEFTYTFSAKKARHNAIQVEYADKDNAYEKTIEYVSDDESIRRNGLNVKKITAFGCTSRGQAHRTGLWLLQTEKLETKTVTFTVGAEGLMHVPGDIIKVADIDYAGTNIGGRALKIVGKKVTLDRETDITANSYFTYINAQAKHQDIKILSVNGAEITLDSEPVGLAEYGVWSLTTQRINAQLFRALSVKEEGKGKYTIVALQHEPQKEAIVDNGAIFEPKATSILSVPKVNDIQIITNADGSIGINADVSGGNGLVKYDILIYKGDNLFDVRLGLKSPELDLSNLANGEYLVVIRARNEKGQLLNERTQRFTIDRPPAPTGVRATGGLGNITLEWDWINEATATEIFAAETDNLSKAKRIAKVTAQMYSHEVGAKQVRYYWLRHTRGINVGPFHQQSGLRAESAVDIDAELDLLNEKLSQNIVNEVIDTALPARNLELIQTVTGLDVNKFTGYKQVHNTADGKLYTWNGKAYTHKVSTNDLEGQIAANQLDSDLMAQLDSTQNIANAANLSVQQLQGNLTQEVNRINQSIRAESANLTKKVQDEAKARGTAITQLQNTDRQQAQQLTTLTAKADQALTGLTEERNSRIAGDNAQTTERTALTARVTAAESGITQLQRGVANQTTALSQVSQNLSSKIDGISVGGRNLIQNSEFTEYVRWGNPVITFSTEQQRRVIKITSTQETSQSGICSHRAFSRSYLQQGRQYTLSFYARGNVTLLNYSYLMRLDGSNQILPFITMSADEENFRQYKLTFTAHFTTKQGYILIGFRNSAVGQWIEFHSLKLESGNIATDWTPAPEDVESDIAKVSADLTAYQRTQAETDSAQATQLNALAARMTGTESNITNLQSTKVGKNEVAALAQTSLQSIWRADAKAEVDKIQVGGRNLLQQSEFEKYSPWGNATITFSTEQPRRRIKIISTKERSQAGINASAPFRKTPILLGETYTLSFFARGNISKLDYCYLIRDEPGENMILPNINMLSEDDFRFYKVTFTTYFATERASILFGFRNSVVDQWVEFHSLKLERGTIATDWTPAPEDVDTALNSVSAKIDSVQSTLSNANNALANRIDTVNASVNNAKAQITTVSQAVADVNGKLSATHTIKTQTISGGKTAIAGITLGANREESSVIVMADRFQVVKNAQDGSPKPMLRVENGKTVFNGELIADGGITAQKMAADSISAAALQAGAVRANHVAAGELTADKLAIGLGGNLLYNPIFANNGNGWTMYVDTNNMDNADWSFNNATGVYQGGAYLPTELKFGWQRNRKNTNGGNVRLGGLYQDLKLVKDKYYCFSAYVGTHRAFIDLNIEQGSVQIIKKSWSGRGITGGYGNNNTDTGIEENRRIYVIFKATGSNATYRMIINMWADGTQNSPVLRIRRPMLEECLPTTKEPNAWQNSGVTYIHGGSIVTNTITAQQIAANTITTNEIAAGTIAARNMAANSINASHVVSKSLTADKLNVSNLAAISANLGRVTAGTITGTTITGNTISGGTVTGTTVSGSTINGGTVKGSVIEGGTIRGARIEGITVEAENIIGDVAKMYSIRTPRQNIGNSKIYSFTLESSKRKRTAVMFPVLMNLYRDNENNYSGVTNEILMNDKLMPMRYEHFDVKGSSGVMTSTFDIPANQRCTITIRLRKLNIRDNDLAEERNFSFFISYS